VSASRGGGPSALRNRDPLRLAAIAGGLVIVPLIAVVGLVLALGDGTPSASGPTAGPTGGASGHAHAPGTAPNHPHGGFTIGDATIGGLAVSAGGYTLVPMSTTLTAGASAPFRFRIHGPDGRPVTRFAIAHGRPMHVVVVRRDLSGYQHLLPTMAADGTWQIVFALPRPGSWRAFADFVTFDAKGARAALTLGVDLTIAGGSRPTPSLAAAREAKVDGYTVTYEGTPQAGLTQPLVFRLFRAGEPVLDLDRYLGAYGHLVALREGDLGYLHVLPENRLFRGAAKFWLSAPSRGRYRLFLDFRVDGRVHTATFAVVVP
jgi:hypothetical protein